MGIHRFGVGTNSGRNGDETRSWACAYRLPPTFLGVYVSRDIQLYAKVGGRNVYGVTTDRCVIYKRNQGSQRTQGSTHRVCKKRETFGGCGGAVKVDY